MSAEGNGFFFHILHLQLGFGSYQCSGWLRPGHHLLDLELFLLCKYLF